MSVNFCLPDPLARVIYTGVHWQDLSADLWNSSAGTEYKQPNRQAFHHYGSLHCYIGGGYAVSSQSDADRQPRFYSVVLNTLR